MTLRAYAPCDARGEPDEIKIRFRLALRTYAPWDARGEPDKIKKRRTHPIAKTIAAEHDLRPLALDQVDHGAVQGEVLPIVGRVAVQPPRCPT